MIEALHIYVKQRLSLAERLGTLAIIVLFLCPLPGFTVQSMGAVIFLFVALIILRLYDDLMQVKNDAGKPNREYINSASDLKKLMLSILLILCALTIFLDLKMGCLFAAFIVVNHIFYLSFVNNSLGALILPLAKYPLLFGFLQLYVWEADGLPTDIHALVVSGVALFFAFLTVDLSDEPRTEGRIQMILLGLVVSFSFVLISSPISIINVLFGALFFIISSLLILFKVPLNTYFFFILFTTFKLICA